MSYVTNMPLWGCFPSPTPSPSPLPILLGNYLDAQGSNILPASSSVAYFCPTSFSGVLTCTPTFPSPSVRQTTREVGSDTRAEVRGLRAGRFHLGEAGSHRAEASCQGDVTAGKKWNCSWPPGHAAPRVGLRLDHRGHRSVFTCRATQGCPNQGLVQR